MQLVWSTDEYKLGGLPIVGFPLHLHLDGTINFAFHSFLVDQLLQRGSAPSKATWKFYGYAIHGFLSFLEISNRCWNEQSIQGQPSVVAGYRIWMLNNSKGRGTINGRLDVLTRFYLFAQKHGYVTELPFGLITRPPSHHYDSGTHSKRSPGAAFDAPDIKLKTVRRTIKVLSAAQASAFLGGFSNATHKLMARLQLATGIRVEELVSFPLRYVVDPRAYPSVTSFFSVRLDCKDMRTKGSVSRTIHVPRDLMAMLWGHMSVERSSRARYSHGDQKQLFLTEEGREYKTRSVWKIYQLSTAPGTRVNPHMLRHTYATHTLRALANVMNIGNALFYVRNRLGHASIKTTEMYLHYIDDAVVSVMDKYQSELTAIVTFEEKN